LFIDLLVFWLPIKIMATTEALWTTRCLMSAVPRCSSSGHEARRAEMQEVAFVVELAIACHLTNEMLSNGVNPRGDEHWSILPERFGQRTSAGAESCYWSVCKN
jgi:hypothetical protein